MSNGRNKYQSREIRSLLNDILLYEWDPIGVQQIAGAQDEYQSYAAKLYVMLEQEKAGKEELLKYLYQVATGHMGLAATPELYTRCENAVEKIIELADRLTLH